MDRFFDIINTPIAALSVVFVMMVVNVFLYFGYYSPKTPTPLPAEQTSPSTTIERPERAQPQEGTLPEVTRPERIKPATTLQSTTPTEPSATVSTATSPSP